MVKSTVRSKKHPRRTHAHKRKSSSGNAPAADTRTNNGRSGKEYVSGADTHTNRGHVRDVRCLVRCLSDEIEANEGQYSVRNAEGGRGLEICNFRT